MDMLKSKGKSLAKTYLAVVFIAIAVYNVVVFVIPFNRGGGFWTGYGFSMLAMLLTAVVSSYASGKEGIKSKVYGMPLIYVAWRYLIIQLVVGLLEIILQQYVPFKYSIALNTVLLGACLIGLITIETAKEEIERIDAKVKEKVFYIKSLQADIEGLIDRASDDSVKKILKDLAETIRYSDPMSSPQLATIENKIEAKAAALADIVGKADADGAKTACNELQMLFAERNRKCKILK